MNTRSLALACSSGLLLFAGFPCINLHLLTWIALVPLLIALQGQNVRQAFLLGGVCGLVFFTGTVYWVAHSIHIYGNQSLLLSALITVLLCMCLALYSALFAAAVSFMARSPFLFLAAPAIWTALELARTYALSGFPWALLGYTQYASLPVIQIADITGVYGVSFLIVLANCGVFEFVKDRKRKVPLLFAVLMTALVLGYGWVRLGSPVPDEPAIRISVVQGNIEQDKKWDPAYQRETFGVYKRLTRETLKDKPDLVIWPETSTPFYFGGNDPEDRVMTRELSEFVRTNKLCLLFGSPTYESGASGSIVLYNSALLLSRDGDVAASYRKIHLVPFGEYVPLKSVLFFVQKMVQSTAEFRPGRDYTVMNVPGKTSDIAISTLICYEIIFPDLVRQFVKKGAKVITTITNDAWFGKTAAPEQHFSMAVFRAVENRVPVARAANTGISGFIDAKGRILASSGIFSEALLTRNLSPGSTRTFYTLYGDLFAYFCLLATIGFLAAARK